MMPRTIYYERFGAPADVLKIRETAVPEPNADEILVRMRARAINPSDLLTIRGTYAHRTTLPCIPGYEGVGVVEAVGSQVKGIAVGSRVLPLNGSGTWQDYVVAPAHRAITVPNVIDDDQAAQLYINPLTAWLILTQELTIQPDDIIAANACGSAFGIILAQLSRVLNYRLVAIVRSAAAQDRLKMGGAWHIINTSVQNLRHTLLELTDGRGVTAALDAVGGETGAELARCLTPQGILLQYGLLSGQPLALSTTEIRALGIQVRGYWLRQWVYNATAEQRQTAFTAVMDLMVQRRMVLTVAAHYPFHAIRTAVQAAESVNRLGKVLLVD